MIRLLLLITILTTCLSEARAEWTVHTTPEGVTLAVLGDIEPGDAVLPKVDAYVIASAGGYFGEALKIADALKGKKVTYVCAMPAAAYIVDMNGIKPLNEEVAKGYHWARVAPGIKMDPEVMQEGLNAIDGMVMKSMLNTYTARYAAQIIALMSDLPDGWMVVDVAGAPAPVALSPARIDKLKAVYSRNIADWNAIDE